MAYGKDMKRFLWFLLWVVGTSIFLLATAHFTLRHLLNTPKFKTAATGFIQRTTGRPAEYGRIDYKLFPFTLVVRDAALKEQDGASEFASIRAFSAAVDFRNKEITTLSFDRPTLRIVQNEDGTYNFSDLLPTPSSEPAAPGEPGAPTSDTDRPAAPPRPEAKLAAPALAIRWVEVIDANFEFIRRDATADVESFTLSDINFTLRDFAADRPLRVEGRAAIGNSSAFQFMLTGPAFADYADRLSAWPAEFTALLDIRNFADVRVFLPPETLPFQSLGAKLNVDGAIADTLKFQLDVQTAEATETHPVAAEFTLTGSVSLPLPVAAHLLGGVELPESFHFSPPPCAPPPGTIALTQTPALALALKYLQAQATVSFPKIAYGQNSFEDGSISFVLHDGTADIPSAQCAAYGGLIDARGSVQLLTCPLAYRLDQLTVDKVEIAQALAANGFDAFAGISGALHLEASASGQGVAEPAIRALTANAQAHIDNLQNVGTGGSLMDQVWLELDNPILLQLVPRLQTKVAQAKQAATTTTTSRFTTATATLALRDGTATLDNVRLAMPGYRIDIAGSLHPFDNHLDLSGKVVASPEETAQLTGGKNRADVLPYEDGGLMIPFRVRGSLHKPRVRPDLDVLLKNALSGLSSESSGDLLDKLSTSDRKHVEKGLEILGGFLKP